jgi:hypothetical protein
MVVVIVLLILVYILGGFWVSDMPYDIYGVHNPIYRPLFVIIWPLLIVSLLVYAVIMMTSDWIDDVRIYYKRKRKVDKENDI